jgi:hypothetical protein
MFDLIWVVRFIRFTSERWWSRCLPAQVIHGRTRVRVCWERSHGISVEEGVYASRRCYLSMLVPSGSSPQLGTFSTSALVDCAPPGPGSHTGTRWGYPLGNALAIEGLELSEVHRGEGCGARATGSWRKTSTVSTCKIMSGFVESANVATTIEIQSVEGVPVFKVGKARTAA